LYLATLSVTETGNCVSKSYYNFFQSFKRLRRQVGKYKSNFHLSDNLSTCKLLKIAKTERFSLVVTICTCIWDRILSNLRRENCYVCSEFSWFSSVLQVKCLDSTSTMPRSLPQDPFHFIKNPTVRHYIDTF
jgi:hypothetical protein